MGLISGFIASKLVIGRGSGVLLNMLLGVVGAFVGGAAFHLVGQVGVTGFNAWSVFVSVIGAVLVLAVFRLVSGATPTRT